MALDCLSQQVVPPELLNMHSVFLQAYKTDKVDEKLVVASIQYTEWSLYVGNPVEDIMQLAIRNMMGLPKLLLAKCLTCVSKVYIHSNKVEKAEACLNQAVELHRQAKDISGEAWDQYKLGHLYLRQSKLNNAEKSLKHAIELHKQAQDVIGEAYDL